jgi:hypothetical protein
MKEEEEDDDEEGIFQKTTPSLRILGARSYRITET